MQQVVGGVRSLFLAANGEVRRRDRRDHVWIEKVLDDMGVAAQARGS